MALGVRERESVRMIEGVWECGSVGVSEGVSE